MLCVGHSRGGSSFQVALPSIIIGSIAEWLLLAGVPACPAEDARLSMSGHAYALAIASSSEVITLIQHVNDAAKTLSNPGSARGLQLHGLMAACKQVEPLMKMLGPGCHAIADALDKLKTFIATSPCFQLENDPSAIRNLPSALATLGGHLDVILSNIKDWRASVLGVDVVGRSFGDIHARALGKPLRFMLRLPSQDIFVEDCLDAEEAACLLMQPSSTLYMLLRELHNQGHESPTLYLSW